MCVVRTRLASIDNVGVVTHDWRTLAQVPDAYRVASLDLVTEKIASIRAVSDTRVTPHLIAHLAAEAAYWLSAVDESIYNLPGYQADREADDVGRLLPGVRYARVAFVARWRCSVVAACRISSALRLRDGG